MQDFCPRINVLKGILLKKILRLMPVRQKLGMVLENKVVQKLKLEKKVFYKKWSPKLIFLNWLWKYDFGTFWQTGISRRIFLNKIPFSMLILGQKPCILDPTIFKIPQPNWHCKGQLISKCLLGVIVSTKFFKNFGPGL